nr:unnamed protein product [Haemonchus contortus]
MVRSRPGLTYTGIVDGELVDIIQRPESYPVRLTSTKAGSGIIKSDDPAANQKNPQRNVTNTVEEVPKAPRK